MAKDREKCPNCKEIRYMTKHHVKDDLGRKTGEIEKMCRDCHDEIEEEYMIKHNSTPKKPKLINLTSHSNETWHQPMQPFYGTKQSILNKDTHKN